MADPRLKLWCLILIVGAGLMFLAFFMPWWGIKVTVPGLSKNPSETQRENYTEATRKIGDALNRDERKHRAVLGDERFDELSDELKDGMKKQLEQARKRESVKSFSVGRTILGWSTGTGITCFIFSFFLLAIGIVPLFVPLLQRWAWIAFYGAAVLGLVGFILSLVWYFSVPYKNVEGLAQGVGWYPGPYLEIFGTLAVLTAGVLGGVFGLLHFLKMRGGSAVGGSALPAGHAPSSSETVQIDPQQLGDDLL